MVHVLQTTQNLVISCCCFAENGKEHNNLYLFFSFSDTSFKVLPLWELKLKLNSEAREWRHDSDKQSGMVDDFEDFFKGKSRCSLWNKNFAYIPCISLRTRLCWLSLAGNSVICIIFLDFARFAIRSIIILVINKSASSCVVVRFRYHSYDNIPELDSTQYYYHYLRHTTNYNVNKLDCDVTF